jgi:hypothetical protein
MERRNFLGQFAAGAAVAGLVGSTQEIKGQIPIDTRSILRAADFGVVGNGKADDSAAIQRAIDQAHKMGGGTVLLEGSAGRNFKCSTPLNFDGRRLVRLSGSSGPYAGESCQLIYSGRTAPFISLRSCYSIALEGLKLGYTDPAFSGSLVATGHTPDGGGDSTLLTFDRCMFVGKQDMNPEVRLLDLNLCIISSVRSCEFLGGAIGIAGVAGAGRERYSNAIQIHDSTFREQGSVAIKNPGESWLISGCTFEPLARGTAGAIRQEKDTSSWALTVIGCWMGDVTRPGGCWIDITQGIAYGLTVISNRMAAAGTSPKDTAIRIGHGTEGVSIIGNRMEGPICIDFTTGTTFGATIIGNDMPSAVPIANLDKVMQHFVAGQYQTQNWMSGITHLGNTIFNSDCVKGHIQLVPQPHPSKPEEGDLWTAPGEGLFLHMNGRNWRVALEPR